MYKTEYIKFLENSSKVFVSVMNYTNNVNGFELFDKKLDFVWGYSEYKEDGVFWNEKVYITKQGFYISVRRKEVNWEYNIYYTPEKYNELIIFIKSLKKEIENARNNNTRT